MAKCSCCGKEYDVNKARAEFQSDEWIVERNLESYYDEYSDQCFNCAFTTVSGDYNTGLEIMSMMGDDD